MSPNNSTDKLGWMPFVHTHLDNTFREEQICDNPPYVLPACPVLNLPKQPEYLTRSITISPAPVTQQMFSNAIMFGASDIIEQGGRLLYLNEPAPEKYELAEEGRGFLKLELPHGQLISTVPPSAVLERAFNLCGSTSSNYVHWLTEYLPKLLLLEEHDKRMWPVLIDDGLPLTMYESILHLLKRPHYVIRLHRYRSVRVRQLLTIHTGTSVPFGFRQANQPVIIDDEVRFSSAAIRLLRTRCAERILDGQPAHPARKLYIKRTSAVRRLLNSEAVAALAARFGYETVEPERYSFTEQVKLFASATHVLGQTGAGIGNILFAPAGCQILLFGANFELANSRYFHSLAHLCGHDMAYFACHPADVSFSHSDMTCDLERLEAQLASQ